MTDLLARLQAALGDTFRVERELTGGGMSRLFLATEASLNRRVVIKLLPPEFTSDVSAARFQREIEVAAHLQHPHILPVLTAGARDDLLYYVMPYVAGESLRHRLTREGKLPVADALRILHEVADALAHAHAEGVIHRDIKPENILLEGSHAVLTDFGVARALADARSGGRLTETGLAVGTPGYMSPEQAAGDQNIDARADVYALAVVGYEMLTGAPPFAGPTAQAILAAHLTTTPRPVADVRKETPQSASLAIARALAKQPSERIQTAAEFRDALGVAYGQAAPEAKSKQTRLAILAGALAAAVLVGALLLRSRGSGSLDPDLIAIAPFDILEPKLGVWREGLVDVLSRNLDGAGPLRTVSPSVVVRRWSGRADPASAAELGRSTGAGLSVYGTIVSGGADSVRLTATVLDVKSARPVGEIQLREAAERMDRLSDSATVAILRELGRSRPIGAARLTSIGSTSLPALRAFLQGEQFYRKSQWDSAQAYYQRASALDSGFALPLARTGQVIGWTRAGGDSLSSAFMLRAANRNHGLSPRDSILLTADSLGVVLFRYQTNLEWTRLNRRLFATLDQAVARYPDDPLMWYYLGEAREHFGFGKGSETTPKSVMEPFDRAIALDSDFTPAYIHPVEAALELDDLALAQRYVDRYLARTPTDAEGEGLRIVAAVLDPARAASADTKRLLDTASADQLSEARTALRRWPDSSEAAIHVARLLVTGRRGVYKGSTDSEANRRQLAWFQGYRGHLQEPEIADPRYRDLFVERGMVGAVPRDTVSARLRRWLKDSAWVPRFAPWWWSENGDTTALRSFARVADSMTRATKDPEGPDPWRYARAAADAYLSLARRDTADALRRLAALPDSLCPGCYGERFPLARLLAARGRDQEAATLLDIRIANPFPGPVETLRALDLGRSYERLKDREKAIANYSFVVRAWRDADPVLKPFVEEARAGLERLTGEKKK